ncbi:hypothetical protein FRX31_022003 [Thalictrum thalictroides]|uniref:RNase H type-1 domain-containing protein n=1 Tax=Thalictrum thalictroides TaxID=46969 RepID=A0A7J6VW63_THATH|nr:hypothetical protein FRX31_022003 [Thalictrum thalictroides]
MAVVEHFSNNNIPWQMLSTWWNATKELHDDLKITHTYKEANFSDDAMSKHGAGMTMDFGRWWDSSPSFVLELENPAKKYYRVCS